MNNPVLPIAGFILIVGLISLRWFAAKELRSASEPEVVLHTDPPKRTGKSLPSDPVTLPTPVPPQIPPEWTGGLEFSAAEYEKAWASEYHRPDRPEIPELKLWLHYCQQYGVSEGALYSTVRSIHVATAEQARQEQYRAARQVEFTNSLNDLTRRLAAESASDAERAARIAEFRELSASFEELRAAETATEAQRARELIRSLSGVTDDRFYERVLSIVPQDWPQAFNQPDWKDLASTRATTPH